MRDEYWKELLKNDYCEKSLSEDTNLKLYDS